MMRRNQGVTQFLFAQCSFSPLQRARLDANGNWKSIKEVQKQHFKLFFLLVQHGFLQCIGYSRVGKEKNLNQKKRASPDMFCI